MQKVKRYLGPLDATETKVPSVRNSHQTVPGIAPNRDPVSVTHHRGLRADGVFSTAASVTCPESLQVLDLTSQIGI